MKTALKNLRLAISVLGVVAAGGAAAQTVNVWLTTPDLQKKLEAQSATAFGAAGALDNPVIVDERRAYQTMEGFGGSLTDSSAYLINQVATSTARTEIMQRLFTRDGDGIGLSFIRNPMGACDYSRSVYSYDDMAMGMMDMTMAGFTIDHDRSDIIPLTQQALQLNPQLKIMANPWSPPAWMKSTGSMLRGTLRADVYDAFALYFVKYIQAYAAQGIPIHYISLQNEPMYEPTGYPGMLMDAATQTVVLRDHVLPALAAAHLSTQVLVYDHNWDHPDYPSQVLSDPVIRASAAVAGTAWHGYGGPAGAMLAVSGAFPDKGNYQTEHSGGTWIGNQFKFDFDEIIHCLRSSARAYVKWNLALDQNRGPFTSIGATSTCSAPVTISTTNGSATYNLEFYTLGHFSKFILPGAQRVYSTNADGVVSAAFVNPDGSRALVAFNETPSSRTFQVSWGDRQFAYTLAAASGATFTWAGSQTGSRGMDALQPILASNFHAASGLETESCTDVLGGYDVGYADNGDYALYRDVDFGAGVASVCVRLASAVGTGTIEFHLDSVSGPRIASVTIPSTGGWQTWQTVTVPVSGATGVHDLCVVFLGGNGNGTANLNWFQFGTSAGAVAPQVSASARTQAVTAGHGTTFHATATGYPAAIRQWQVSSNAGSTWTDLVDGANYTGTGTATLAVGNALASMDGLQYRLMATNSAGAVASPVFTLNVVAAIFPSPAGVAADAAGNLWVCDSSNNTLQKVTGSSATLLAGSTGQQGSADGTGAAALFRQPGGMALDGAGNLYVADTGNSLIRKVTAAGVVTTVAGSAANQGYRDGTGTEAWFNAPAGLCLDGAGNLYVADAGNSVIRKVTPAGVVTTVAGTAGARGTADGTGASARFNQPGGIAIDTAGTLCVADTLNQTIRRISPTGAVTTWVGLAGVAGTSDGSGAAALFNQPMGMCFDGAGNLYVADSGNASIRAVTPAGVVGTLAGLSSISGLMDGMGTAAWFNSPKDVKADGGGSLYVADTGNAVIRKVTLAGAVTTLNITAASSGGGGGGGGGGATNPPPPSGGGGGGGGGGAFGWPFILAMTAALLFRAWRLRRPHRRA